MARGFVASLIELSGFGWSVPDFSTLSRRQKTLNVTIPYRGSKGPLLLLVDSTSIKVEGEGERHMRKHGGLKRRVWRKIHPGIDIETLKIRAVEATSSNVGDARQDGRRRTLQDVLRAPQRPVQGRDHL